TGLFCGIFGTLSCFIYAIAYRFASGYNPTIFINVSILIFGCNTLMLCVGIIYFEFKEYIPNGQVIFISIFILLTTFLLWKVQQGHSSPIQGITEKFRRLMSGIIIILGVYAAVLLPYLYNNRKFIDLVV
ncbi:MAG TPA: hypothetical protein VKR53_06200, partial [Puia sp.]|nr:hypothetical protein [Puia sp.]